MTLMLIAALDKFGEVPWSLQRSFTDVRLSLVKEWYNNFKGFIQDDLISITIFFYLNCASVGISCAQKLALFNHK